MEEGVPWSEKYRPKHLRNIIGNKKVIRMLRRKVKNLSMQHMIFVGPPGSGKTTAAHACIHEFGCKGAYKELNASDERGISVVRNQIKSWTSTVAISKTAPFKILLLDEGDKLTEDAQDALRRQIETGTAMFIITANDDTSFISALTSRCKIVRFRPIKPDVMAQALYDISEKEGYTMTDDAMGKILKYSHGDMRDALNTLQAGADSCHNSVIKGKDITLGVESFEMEDTVKLLECHDFEQAYNLYHRLWKYGINAKTILESIIELVDSGSLIRKLGFKRAIALSKSFTEVSLYGNVKMQFLSFLAKYFENLRRSR